MTLDEFRRILVAASQMRGYHLNGESYVPLWAVLEVVKTQLPEKEADRVKYNARTGAWFIEGHA